MGIPSLISDLLNSELGSFRYFKSLCLSLFFFPNKTIPAVMQNRLTSLQRLASSYLEYWSLAALSLSLSLHVPGSKLATSILRHFKPFLNRASHQSVAFATHCVQLLIATANLRIIDHCDRISAVTWFFSITLAFFVICNLAQPLRKSHCVFTTQAKNDRLTPSSSTLVLSSSLGPHQFSSRPDVFYKT